MSFKDKTNLVGLEIEGLALRSNSDGSSNGILPINGSDGSILGYEKYGEIKNPTCEYAIVGSTLLSNIDLGKCYNGQYALNSITVSTGAGQEPTFSATAV